MDIKRATILGRLYIFRNYGDGWDVYYHNGRKNELLEEGCASWEAAYKIATEHAEMPL